MTRLTFQRETVLRMLRFGLVGVAVMLFFMGANWLLAHRFAPQAAFFLAYPPALALHFLLNKLWTFGDRRATSARHLAEYLFTVVVTFLIQWPVFTLVQEYFAAPGWLAAGVANAVQMTASFLLLRGRVFGAGQNQAGAGAAWSRLLALLVTLALAALLAWTAFAGWKLPGFQRKEYDYYNLLVDGFRKGSSALDVEVPEALKNAKNPWNPDERPAGVAMHDVSYFDGRYYLYFGVAPVVTLFLPFRLLTGLSLPLTAAVAVFGIGALLGSAWLWLRFLRDHFPGAGLATRIGGILVVGIAGGQLGLARRASMWEMPIAAGHFFLTWMILAAYLALRTRRPWPWLAAVGLGLGLAVGSRPTLVAAGGGLGCLALAFGWRRLAERRWAEGIGRTIRAALVIGLPLFAVMAGLLAYNYARFHHPLEFGLNYQLTSNYEAKAKHFSFTYVPFNAAMYFWEAPHWGRYFPFLHPVSPPVQPADYYGSEYVYGAFVTEPVIWFMLLVPVWFLARGRPDGSLLRSFGLMLLAIAGGTTALLLCFNTAAARYTVDFIPWCLWLALLGWAALEAWSTRWKGWGRMLRTVFLGSAIFSAGVAFCASVELHGVLEFLNPEAYRSLIHFFSRPIGLWETWSGQPVGAIEMDVTFPDQPSESNEPLVVTGVEYQMDYIFVFYKSGHALQLGYAATGRDAVYGPEVTVVPGQSYHLRIEMGSLYPPQGHPAFDDWSAGEIAAHKHWVKIVLDGRALVDRAELTNEASPGTVSVGVNAQNTNFGRRFTGTIANVRRMGLPRISQDVAGGGDVVLHFSFPSAASPAPSPLLVAGRSGRADLVSLRMVDPGHFKLGYESWSAGYWESETFAVPESRAAFLRVRLGSVLQADRTSPLRVLTRDLVVWMDDRLLWWRRLEVGLESEPPLIVAANTIGSTATALLFDGRLMEWQRTAAPAPWRVGPFGGIALTLAGSGEGIEPVLATGRTGRADTVAIEWRVGGRARLIYDHWGYALRTSPEFDWAPGILHRLQLDLPALRELDAPGQGTLRSGTLKAEVDGRPVWEEAVDYYSASADSLVIGENRAGSSAAAPEFRGAVIEVVQGASLAAGTSAK